MRREGCSGVNEMYVTRLCLYFCALIVALVLGAYLFALVTNAQTRVGSEFRPDTRRALVSRTGSSAKTARQDGYAPLRSKGSLEKRPRTPAGANELPARRPARPAVHKSGGAVPDPAAAALSDGILRGTPLARVLHTSQLSITTSAGAHEQFVDQTGDLKADARTTFDSEGGSFDIALGRSGARYEVFTSVDDRGTSGTGDDISFGVLVVALDTNGDYVRDSSSAFDLERDFRLPSAVSVVSGTSRSGREFVIVSSSGYFNRSNPNDPNNEPSAGVVLLVRDSLTGGFDNSRSRELVRVGDNRLNNANALALLPTGDLLIADFDSNELRIVRDTDADGLPDALDVNAYYSYQFSDDAPLDIAVNSRGVVFSHSFGKDAVMLALYDRDGNGRADTEEVVVEGLSLDNNLIFHGLTVDRAGTVYVIEDASGAADTVADGGNGGSPRIDAFPDPALNGILRDGALYASADDANSQALSGLSFGVDAVFGPVGRLALVNSASLRGTGVRDGLASILGTGLTGGARGATEQDAAARGVRVHIEGRSVPVLSFSDSQVNIYIPGDVARGTNSVVVSVNGNVTAAGDAAMADASPGLFTISQTGAGEAIALLVSGNRYTGLPFPASVAGQPSVIALFGTGWRNSLPLTVSIGGRAASVQYSGPAGGFPGLDQINVAIPEGVSGAASVVVTTAGGATSRNDVSVSFK